MLGFLNFEKLKGCFMKDILLLLAVVFTVIFFGCAKKDTVADRPSEFQQAGSLITSGQYRTVAVADMDNDGNMDVIGGSNLPGTVAIWYGDGRGGLPEYQFLPIKADVRSVSTSDINNDGRLDLVFSVQREALGIMVWINEAGRTWIRGFGPDQVKEYENIQTADINWDGFEDIIAANSTEKREGGIQVWLGDGKGNWPVETGPTNEGIYMDVALADFNKDGRLDIHTSLRHDRSGSNDRISIWINSGASNPRFTEQVLANSGSHFSKVGDIGGDGDIDIIGANWSSSAPNGAPIELWENLSEGDSSHPPAVGAADMTFDFNRREDN